MSEPEITRLGGKFEFEIARVSTSADTTHWTVQLPHQCQEWEVAWSSDPRAVEADLVAFIGEAEQALAKLRELAP